MSIFYVFLVIILVGVALYVVNQVITMDAKVKQIFNVVAILVLLVWLFSVFVGFDHVGSMRVGHCY